MRPHTTTAPKLWMQGRTGLFSLNFHHIERRYRPNEDASKTGRLEAEGAGLQMRPTKLLIFGNPEAGTPVIVASPTIAIDLPLKILVWEDSRGKIWVSYKSRAYLQARHNVPPHLVQNIAVVEALASKAAE